MTSFEARDQLADPPYLDTLTKVTRFAEIDEILRSKDFAQGAHRESEPFFGESLLLLDGDPHFERRRMESPLFAKAALLFYESEALDPVIDRSMQECANDRDGGEPVRADLVPLVRTMLHRITAATTGIDGVDGPEATERFRWLVEKLGEAVTVEWSTRDHEEVIAEGLVIRNLLVEEFYAASFARRRALVEGHRAGSVTAEELPRDLLTMLCLHWDPAWDDELPLREAALFLVAATQTTTHAIPHVVLHLSEWFEAHPEDRAVALDKEFLRSAANESLRLHLPSPSLIRVAARDVTLSTGRTVAEGERVALLATPANRDPEVFGPDADAFDPHRDSPFKQRPWGLTFGGGEHLCIGRPLVTGLSSRTDGEVGTEGTMVKILTALVAAGVELDPERPPVHTTASHHDAYESFPVVFTGFSQAATGRHPS